jgi:hypothetical protein
MLSSSWLFMNLQPGGLYKNKDHLTSRTNSHTNDLLISTEKRGYLNRSALCV